MPGNWIELDTSLLHQGTIRGVNRFCNNNRTHNTSIRAHEVPDAKINQCYCIGNMPLANSAFTLDPERHESRVWIDANLPIPRDGLCALLDLGVIDSKCKPSLVLKNSLLVSFLL